MVVVEACDRHGYSVGISEMKKIRSIALSTRFVVYFVTTIACMCLEDEDFTAKFVILSFWVWLCTTLLGQDMRMGKLLGVGVLYVSLYVMVKLTNLGESVESNTNLENAMFFFINSKCSLLISLLGVNACIDLNEWMTVVVDTNNYEDIL
jgi:hypothetical protein